MSAYKQYFPYDSEKPLIQRRTGVNDQSVPVGSGGPVSLAITPEIGRVLYLNKYWVAGIGVGIYDHETEADELTSAVKYNVPMTYVGYSLYCPWPVYL